MSVSDLSASTQNYLKAVWSLNEWSDEPVTASTLARQVGVKLSTASDAIRKLTSQGFLEHTPYGAVALTPTGRFSISVLDFIYCQHIFFEYFPF